jgi:hypothetical protein
MLHRFERLNGDGGFKDFHWFIGCLLRREFIKTTWAASRS